jgi:hypothetical protein
MNKQRGIISQVYLYGAVVLAIIIAATAGIAAWHSFIKSIDKAGYDRGVAETQAAYKERDNTQLQAVVAAQKAAEVKARAAEDKAATAQSEALTAYKKGITDGKNKLAAFISATPRLRDPSGSSGACTAGSGGATTATTTADPGRADEQDGGGRLLSEAASVFLISEAVRANAVITKLNLAREVILTDHQVCDVP